MRSTRPISLLVLAALALLAALPVGRALALDAGSTSLSFSEQSPVQIHADAIEYEKARDLYTAAGHVEIHQGARTLTADWVSFSNKTRQGVASGNVVVREAGELLRASFLQFSVDSLEGVYFDGKFEGSKQVAVLEGSEVRKTGENNYHIKNLRFTACKCPKKNAREPWQIRAEQADLEIGGYGTVKNSNFDILDVPVMWFPWMMFPLKTERQTGFLFPEVGTGSFAGGNFALPFFWAARDNINVLITPRNLSKHGFKPEVETEYVFGKESGGSFFGSYLRDNGDDFDDPNIPYDRRRWLVTGEHNQILPGGWRLAAEVNRVSDNEYLYDFGDISGARSLRRIASHGFVEKSFGKRESVGLTTGALLTDDLQSPDNLDRDKVALQRLPEVRLAALPRPLPGIFSRFLASADVEYTYFRSQQDRRDDFAGTIIGQDLFGDVGLDGLVGTGVAGEGNGRFDEGEPLLDRAHRLHLTPRISLPLRLADTVELLAEVGYNQSFYDSRAQGSAEHGFVTGRLDLRARMRRSFGAEGKRITHYLEPRITYAVLSPHISENDPMLVPETALPDSRIRRLDLRNVTRDSADRIESFNGIVAGVGNKFYSEGSGEAGGSRLLAEVSLDLEYQFTGSQLGVLAFDGKVYPWEGFAALAQLEYDYAGGGVDQGLLELEFKARQGSSVSLTYRYRHNIPRILEDYPASVNRFDRFDKFDPEFNRIHQVSLGSRLVLTPRWSAIFGGAYNLESSQMLVRQEGIIYTSRCNCWSLQVLHSEHQSRGGAWAVAISLSGLGQQRQISEKAFLP